MGLLLLIAVPGVIRFAPALIVSDIQIAEADQILRAAVTEFLATATPAA
jgi:acetylornithine/N-succinyldiaminopimelate aminotransferase